MRTKAAKTCPRCKSMMMTGVVQGRREHICPMCQHSVPIRATSAKLPGLDPGPQEVQIQEREKALVRRIVRTLKISGYAVLQIGQRDARGSGTTEGCPDLFVSHADWGALWQPMEIKTDEGTPRDAQQALIDRGLSVIVRSVEQALWIVQKVNERLSNSIPDGGRRPTGRNIGDGDTEMVAQGLTIRNGQEMSHSQPFEVMNLNDVMSYAEIFCKSGYFSDAVQANQAAVKILAGQELGIKPFQAMNGIHIIKGKTCLAAGLMASLVKASRKYDYKVLEHTETACKLMFYVMMASGQYEELGESRFGIEDAKRQNTQNIGVYPKNMLFNRAMSNGVKWHCADIFAGPVYVPEDFGATVNDQTGEVLLPEPGQSPARAARAQNTRQIAAPPAETAEEVPGMAELCNALAEQAVRCWTVAGLEFKTDLLARILDRKLGKFTQEWEAFNVDDFVRILVYAIHQGRTIPLTEPIPSPRQILADAEAFEGTE